MSRAHGILSSKFALLLVATIFLFALATPAHAQVQGCPPVRLHVSTGNDLYALLECQTSGPCDGDRVLGFTVGYIHGVADALMLEGKVRSGGGITIGQLVDIVEKWVKEHPELRDRSAATCVAHALTEALPPEGATKSK